MIQHFRHLRDFVFALGFPRFVFQNLGPAALHESTGPSLAVLADLQIGSLSQFRFVRRFYIAMFSLDFAFETSLTAVSSIFFSSFNFFLHLSGIASYP